MSAFFFSFFVTGVQNPTGIAPVNAVKHLMDHGFHAPKMSHGQGICLLETKFLLPLLGALMEAACIQTAG
ncbi:hypothetical protein SADUNF_Sadunf06G0068400 [Salix dunnii]|uniref:Uncharacterized protein n=1 Tax=Salix dunnii TaxID=1413687 RepID=A0A835K0X2_9ROSI|nr:hypothetical protein SADUNF_Sadunf06G0068400 [Salix dunnii]